MQTRHILLGLVLGLWSCSTIQTAEDRFGYKWTLSRAPVDKDKWQYRELTELMPVCREAFSCTVIVQPNKSCVIYLPKNAPEWVKIHEESHCEGWDHQPRTYSEIAPFLPKKK